MRNLFKAVVAAGLLLVNAGMPAMATSPSQMSAVSNVKQRVKAVDSAYGFGWQNVDIGFKVFASTGNASVGTAAYYQLTDEAGTVVNQGLVHAVCISSGAATSNYAVLFDSAPAAVTGLGSMASQSVWQLTPLINASTTGEHCLTLDVQFNNGIVLMQSVGSGTSFVLWRPIGGKN